jgi:hypothetical protein
LKPPMVAIQWSGSSWLPALKEIGISQDSLDTIVIQWFIGIYNNHYKDPYCGWDDHQPFFVSIDHGSYGLVEKLPMKILPVPGQEATRQRAGHRSQQTLGTRTVGWWGLKYQHSLARNYGNIPE